MLRESLITKSFSKQSGMSLVEIILAVAIFAILSTGVIGAIIYGQESTEVAGARDRAIQIAEEGIEAVRNIRDSGYNNLPVDGNYGLLISGGVWTLSGSSDTTDFFTRTITLATIDSRTKNITVNVTWNQTAERSGSISLNTYLTDWVTAPIIYRKGMLVYGDGSTTSDAIKYQIYDDSTGVWSIPAATMDIDNTSTNRYLRVAKVYSSSTRNEYVLVSRHYNGTTQRIYAQVYNGNTNTWGNLVQLSSWNTTDYLDVQNFDATYMANGNLMVIYSDNSTTPKYRIWNGTAWSVQASLTNFGTGQIPTYIITKARSATNEIMVAALTQESETKTEYYSGTAWSIVTTHATDAPVSTKRLVDFDWSTQDTTRGELVYVADSTGNDSRRITSRIWTANGTGSGVWSATGVSSTQGIATTKLATVKVIGIKGANEFQTCDQNTILQIICYKTNFTPIFTNPTNQTLTTTTDNGIQRSFDIGTELSGSTTIGVYSDATTTTKLKKYNQVAAVWDPTAMNVNSSAAGVIKTVRIISNPISDDMMVLIADNNRDLFSIGWDGTNNQLYVTPVGKAWTAHGVNGSVITDYWYDFAWSGM
jgi:prepilin-type N-terminal cleavage/methylation domain-containing protein